MCFFFYNAHRCLHDRERDISRLTNTSLLLYFLSNPLHLDGADALLTAKDEYNTLCREMDCTFANLRKF